MRGIVVVAEHRQGELRETSLESLGAASGLSSETIVAVLSDTPRDYVESFEGRAQSLRLFANPNLGNFNPELYLPPVMNLVLEKKPSLVVMGHTSQGMELAPALAGRLSAPLITDCVGLEKDGDQVIATRQIYSGKVVQTLTLKPAETIICTVQPGAFTAPDALEVKTRVQELALKDDAPCHARRFIEYLEASSEDVDITASEILVSVGRGIGSSDDIEQAQTLAERLGATLSCSRPVADAGWLPKSRQVGTSGKAVRPKVYIALGISGAFQHLAGMKASGTIIAINKDPRAPIFQVAHYGIVADLFEVLPKLVEEFG